MEYDFRSGDALFAFDSKLRIISWNPAAEELTGIGADEAVGRRCWEVVCGTDERGSLICHAGCSDARLVAKGWPVCSKRLSIKTANGRRDVTVTTIAVRNGEPVFLHVLRNGLEHPAETDEPSTGELTPRQLEVLALLAAGVQAREIAEQLRIAETTVRNHIRMILLELGCHSQLQAVAEARKRRLLP